MNWEKHKKYESVLERILENPFRTLLTSANATEAELDDAKDDVLFQFSFGIPEGELPFELAEFEVSERTESEVNRMVQALATADADKYRMFWFLNEQVPMTWNQKVHVERIKQEQSAEAYDAFLAALLYCVLNDETEAKDWQALLAYVEYLKAGNGLAEVAGLRGLTPSNLWLEEVYEEICRIYQSVLTDSDNFDLTLKICALQPECLFSFRQQMKAAWEKYYQDAVTVFNKRFAEIVEDCRQSGENSREYGNIEAEILKYYPRMFNEIKQISGLYASDNEGSIFDKLIENLESNLEGLLSYYNYEGWSEELAEAVMKIDSVKKYYRIAKYCYWNDKQEQEMGWLEEGIQYGDITCMVEYCSKLRMRHEYDKAVEIAQKLIEKNPERGNEELGTVLLAKDDLEGAAKCYKVAVDTYGSAAKAAALASICYKLGRTAEAIRYAGISIRKWRATYTMLEIAKIYESEHLWYKAAYTYIEIINDCSKRYSTQSMYRRYDVRDAMENLQRLGIKYVIEEQKFYPLHNEGLQLLRQANLYDAEDDYVPIDQRIEAVAYAAQNGQSNAFLKLSNLYLHKIFEDTGVYTKLDADRISLRNALMWLEKAVGVKDGRIASEEAEKRRQIINLYLNLLNAIEQAHPNPEPDAWKRLGSWYQYDAIELLGLPDLNKTVVYKKAAGAYVLAFDLNGAKPEDVTIDLLKCCEAGHEYIKIYNVLGKREVPRYDLMGIALYKAGEYKAASEWLTAAKDRSVLTSERRAKIVILAAKSFEACGDLQTAKSAYQYVAHIPVGVGSPSCRYYAIAEWLRMSWDKTNTEQILADIHRYTNELRELRLRPLAYARFMYLAAELMRSEGHESVAAMYEKQAKYYDREFEISVEEYWKEVDESTEEYYKDIQSNNPMHIMVDKMHHIMSNDNYTKELKNLVLSTQNSNNQFEKRMLNKVLKILDVSDEQRKVINNLMPSLVGY